MFWDAFALIAALFIGFGIGGVVIAGFLYVLEQVQNGDRR